MGSGREGRHLAGGLVHAGLVADQPRSAAHERRDHGRGGDQHRASAVAVDTAVAGLLLAYLPHGPLQRQLAALGWALQEQLRGESPEGGVDHAELLQLVATARADPEVGLGRPSGGYVEQPDGVVEQVWIVKVGHRAALVTAGASLGKSLRRARSP